MPELQGYSDLTRIGRGGMATVYRGRQTSLERAVAIKFLAAEHLWDEPTRALFDQESLVIARLNHPNIVHVIDRGFSNGGRPYFVMEYVEGQDLGEKLDAGKLSLQARILLILQLCSGLAYAHKNGVIHRDIKPSNLVVDGEGQLKILDFGIAWLDKQGRPDSDLVYGTPDYMSPEQFSSPDEITNLSDIYALGAVMYEMLVGKKHRDDITNWAAALDKLPHGIATIIRQCLADEPAERPPSADSVRLNLLRQMRGTHLGDTQKREANATVGPVADKFNLLDVIQEDRRGAAYLFEDIERKRLLVIRKRKFSKAGIAEAKLLTGLKHANLAEIVGTSSNDKASIVVMKHLSGGSLIDRLSRAYAGDRFVKLALQLCAGLQAAYQAGVAHGNLHPGNLLFDRRENLRIADFGSDPAADNNDYRPVVSKPPMERDLYAIAAIFHRLTTGEALAFAHQRVQPGDGFDGLDPLLQALLRDLLEPDAQHRIEDIEALTARLKALKGKLRDPLKAGKNRRMGWLLAGAAMLATIAAGAWLVLFDTPLLDSLLARIGF